MSTSQQFFLPILLLSACTSYIDLDPSQLGPGEDTDTIDIVDTTSDSPQDQGEEHSGCPDVCSLGSNECYGADRYRVCSHYDADGCLSWGEPVYCGNNSACESGECECIEHFADCDRESETGCEADLRSSVEHCGECDNACGSNTGCVDRECRCQSDFADCNDSWGDGCETDLTSILSCGLDCSTATECSDANGIHVHCEFPGVCSLDCNDGYGDCNIRIASSDGCETDLMVDYDHCGSCSHPCEVYCAENAGCVDGQCTYDACREHCLDEDGSAENGCEYWDYYPKVIGVSDTHTFARSAAITPDGGIALLLDGNSYPAWLWKLDAAGHVEFQADLDRYDYSVTQTPRAIRNTSDGGYISAGCSSASNASAWVVKLSDIFAVEWKYLYWDADQSCVSAIVETADGGYVAAGRTASWGAGGFDFFVIRLSATGTVVWEFAYGGEGQDQAMDVELTSDGGFVVSGRTDSFGSGGTDIMILRLDQDGVPMWSRTYGGVDDESGGGDVVDLVVAEDGGFLVVSSSDTFASASSNSASWYFKLDAAGELAWQYAFGDGSWSSLSSVAKTGDGGYVMVGSNTSAITTYSNVVAVGIGEDGTFAWQEEYGLLYSSEYSDFVGLTSEGEIFITAETTNMGPGDYDVLVLKLNSDGSIEGDCPSDMSSHATFTRSATTAVGAPAAITVTPSHVIPGTVGIAVVETAYPTHEVCEAPLSI